MEEHRQEFLGLCEKYLTRNGNAELLNKGVMNDGFQNRRLCKGLGGKSDVGHQHQASHFDQQKKQADRRV